MGKDLILLATSILAFATSTPTDGQEKTLTVMSYNIRNSIGMDEVRDIERTASVINKVKPDIVAVQELDSVTGRSGGRYVLGDLADATGMTATYAPAINYDGGKYGIGILSRAEPTSVMRVPLPGREEARMLVIAEFPEYVVACTHLSLTPEDAEASTDTLRSLSQTYDKPFILCGDFNSTPGSKVINKLTETFDYTGDYAPTFPADKPEECFDYIFVSKEPSAEVVSFNVVEAPQESDHRPIVTGLRTR